MFKRLAALLSAFAMVATLALVASPEPAEAYTSGHIYAYLGQNFTGSGIEFNIPLWCQDSGFHNFSGVTNNSISSLSVGYCAFEMCDGFAGTGTCYYWNVGDFQYILFGFDNQASSFRVIPPF